MRLLNVKTMQLEEFIGSDIPNYAILSHCWGKGEVGFQDINGSNWRSMPGSIKIEYAARQSEKDGLDYVWVDTCCIDKTSSAELSESINSMYKWYQAASVCYAYLQDVAQASSELHSESLEFRRSRWFTRGWTLQELLAPSKVKFFGSDWIYLGDKLGMAAMISSITRVQEEAVENPRAVSYMSVARRMSWAARRRTTRIEDIAYCLLGIFDVNMPLLYGEGEKAFIRLQEEILKQSDDQSLLAWNSPNPFDDSPAFFALAPEYFIDSGDIVPIPSTAKSQPYSVTNKGLYITILLSECQPIIESIYVKKPFIALLDCHHETDFSGCLGIILEQTETPNVFQRPGCRYKDSLRKCTTAESAAAVEQTIYICNNSIKIQRSDFFLIKATSAEDYGFQIVEVSPNGDVWNEETHVLKARWHKKFTFLRFRNEKLNTSFFVFIS